MYKALARTIGGLFLAATLAVAPGVRAQAPEPAVAPAPVTSDALAFARVFFRDSAFLPATINALSGDIIPKLRAEIVAGPGYASLAAASQAKILTVVDALPGVLTSELTAAIPDMEIAGARSLEATLTAPELRDIATYLSSPDGGVFVRKILDAGFRASAAAQGSGGLSNADKAAALNAVISELSESQLASAVAFAATPGGRAFSTKTRQLSANLKTTVQSTLSARTPTIMARLQHDLCDAVGPADCQRVMASLR